MITEKSMIERFGSRARMAFWCRVSLHTVYNWPRGEAGEYLSQNTRNTVIAGLVRMETAARHRSGIPVPSDDWELLRSEVEPLLNVPEDEQSAAA